VRRVLRRLRRELGTIRARLTLWYVALLAAILLPFSVFLYASLARNLLAEIDRSLAEQVTRIADPIDLRDDGRIELGDAVDDLPVGLVVALYGPAGQQLAGGGRQPVGVVAAAMNDLPRDERSIRTISAGGDEWRVLTAPLVDAGTVVAVVQVARSEHDVEVALRQLRILLALAVPATLLVAVAGGLFLAGRALNPIDRITRAAAQIGAEDLSRRLAAEGGPDEVGRLAATFDQMLERLDHAFQRERRFTADASHELRTPLALSISQAEVALSRPRSVAEYRRVIASMADDSRRMSRLVAGMLTLARADVGEEPLSAEPLDLGELVDDVVTAMQPLARSRGVSLTRRGAASAVVAGDQTRLTQLLVNLLDNALKYTSAGGTVGVSVELCDATALLRVADNGVGIAAEHLPHLFERFYRVDRGRARLEGGVGLGLAICQWIARAHGGDVAVASTPGKGTSFTVSLPIRPGTTMRKPSSSLQVAFMPAGQDLAEIPQPMGHGSDGTDEQSTDETDVPGPSGGGRQRAEPVRLRSGRGGREGTDRPDRR
jgi:heavy metal sensor kinase